MTQTSDIVAKLWNLCHILRDGGISYHQYVTELTLLLFLKMAKETGKENRIPKGCRWDDLLALPPGGDKLDAYKEMLLALGRASDPLVKAIYTGAQTTLREARHLERLVLDIDGLDWFTAKTDGLGDMYEGLLERNASETKSGAGQYFTPRPLIEAMVDVVKPQAGEVIQDPAAGTAGFLIAADTYIKKHTDQLFELGDKEQKFQKREAFVGLELVPETRRLALMNCMLHDIDGIGRRRGAARRHAIERRCQVAPGRPHHDEPALRYEEGRGRRLARRHHVSDEQQTADVLAAHLPRTQGRRTCRRGAA